PGTDDSQWGQEPGTQRFFGRSQDRPWGEAAQCGRAPPARTRQLTWQAVGGACMLACARRASVILFVLVTAFALFAPATDAEPRSDLNRPLPTYRLTAPVTGTHLGLSPRHRTIKYRHAVRLSAQLSSKFGPIKNETVTWWSHRPGGEWKRVAAAKTNKSGRTTLKRRLTHTTRWQVRY